jgi:hypothetical protein
MVSSGFTATVVITKNITLLGGYNPADFNDRQPDAYTTTIDADSRTNQTSLAFMGGTTATVDGFRITGATDCWVGGAAIFDASPTLRHNWVVGNHATWSGGGIHVRGSSTPTIESNVIAYNTANDFGGGIFVDCCANVVISGNQVYSNTAGDHGGGLNLWFSTGMIYSNTIQNNMATDVGGGIVLSVSPLVIRANTIVSNSAAHNAAGLWIDQSSAVVDSNLVAFNSGNGIRIWLNTVPLTLTNNVIVHNAAEGIGAFDVVTDVRLINNTIAYNGGEGVLVGLDWGDGLTGTVSLIRNNIIVSNTLAGVWVVPSLGSVGLADYNDLWANPRNLTLGPGNISANPQFVNPTAGDFRIRFGSPVVNAGTNVGAPAYDRDGVTRPQGSRVDMGAYEVIVYSTYLPIVLRNR